MSIAISDNGLSLASMLPARNVGIADSSAIDPMASASVAALSDPAAQANKQNKNVAAEAAALESQSVVAQLPNRPAGSHANLIALHHNAADAGPDRSTGTVTRRAVERYQAEDFPKAGNSLDQTV
jgi:peptidoglycan hydrolase-like protein with peptidoglycan-binding domain